VGPSFVPSSRSLELSNSPHRFADLGPHNELEFLAYLLLYVLEGSLPWTHSSFEGLTLKMSMDYDAERPEVFVEMLELCEQRPTGLPDYVMFKQKFSNAMTEAGLEDDGVFEWVKARRGS
jgi:hypothetical protein